MMKPELNGIHVNFSFEVSSYSGQTVYWHMIHSDFAYVSQIWSMLTSTQVYSLTKIWWRLNWAEFLWINANFSFEVPSYFDQTVESWPHMISFFRFLDFFDKDSNDEVEISKFEHLDFKGIKFELYQLIFCCFFICSA